MTVMEEVLTDELSDRGSTPLRSISECSYEHPSIKGRQIMIEIKQALLADSVATCAPAMIVSSVYHTSFRPENIAENI